MDEAPNGAAQAGTPAGAWRRTVTPRTGRTGGRHDSDTPSIEPESAPAASTTAGAEMGGSSARRSTPP